MNFDPDLALSYARDCSRPRHVGSDTSKKVAQEIADRLAGSGFSVCNQPFHFLTSFERFLNVEIGFGLLLVLSILWLNIIDIWMSMIPVVLLVALLMLNGRLTDKIQRNSFASGKGGSPFWSAISWRLGIRIQTKNIVASLPGQASAADLPHLYLVAHYDSKSQRLPLVLRIALFAILIGGSLVTSLLSVIDLLVGSLTSWVIASGILVLISGIPLLWLGSGNKSPGAIDNASGVGLVLHLAEILASKPGMREKLVLTILITGGEELGLKGALAHVLLNETGLDRQAASGGLYVLNFDGVGIDGKLYLVGGGGQSQQSGLPDLSRLVYKSAGEFGISLGRFFLPGAMFDHQPFVERGYDALSVIAIGKDSLAIHTAGDSPDRLHPKGFDQAGRLVIRVIEKISGQSFN